MTGREQAVECSHLAPCTDTYRCSMHRDGSGRSRSVTHYWAQYGEDASDHECLACGERTYQHDDPAVWFSRCPKAARPSGGCIDCGSPVARGAARCARCEPTDDAST